MGFGQVHVVGVGLGASVGGIVGGSVFVTEGDSAWGMAKTPLDATRSAAAERSFMVVTSKGIATSNLSRYRGIRDPAPFYIVRMHRFQLL
jgi:hypothetical protein